MWDVGGGEWDATWAIHAAMRARTRMCYCLFLAGASTFTRCGLYSAYLLVELRPLAGDGGDVGCDAGLDQQLVDLLELLAVLRHVVEQCGKVEAKGAVELALNHAGRHDAAAEVDGLVGEHQVVKEAGLAVDNLARLGADPEVAGDELVAAQQAAVCKLGQAIFRLGAVGRDGGRHCRWWCREAAVEVVVAASSSSPARGGKLRQ